MTARNVYRYTAKGLALPAEIVAIAFDLQNAETLVKQWCRDNGVNPETLTLVSQTKFTPPQIVFAWDGSY